MPTTEQLVQGSPIVQLWARTPPEAEFFGHIKYSISTYCSHILKTFLAQNSCISIVYLQKNSQIFKLTGIHITGNFRDPIELGLLIFAHFQKLYFRTPFMGLLGQFFPNEKIYKKRCDIFLHVYRRT